MRDPLLEMLGAEWQVRVAGRVASELCALYFGGLVREAELVTGDEDAHTFCVIRDLRDGGAAAPILIAVEKKTGVALRIPFQIAACGR